MANILSRIWSALTACFQRRLDDEIVRVIEQREEQYANYVILRRAQDIPATQTPPPVIIMMNGNAKRSPRIKRRNAVSGLEQLETPASAIQHLEHLELPGSREGSPKAVRNRLSVVV